MTESEMLHDFYLALYRAAALHPSKDWAHHLRQAAERTRDAFRSAESIAKSARQSATITSGEAYIACSQAQTAAIRVMDAIEKQVF